MRTKPDPTAALVREVSPDLGDAQLTFVHRQPVDIEVARRQHDGYVGCLASLGLDIVRLPPAPEHPDGVFVEDAVVLIDSVAVLTRPGASSRRAEVGSVRAAVEARGLAVASIEAPGTLDGGDILQIGQTVHVGRTTRTNQAGIEQLTALVEPLGRHVIPVDVRDALHLKTAATALPDATIIASLDRVDLGAFAGREVIAAPEPAGANVLLFGDTVIVSAAAPATAAIVRKRGFAVQTVEITELEKAEAGPTCLTVLLPGRR